MSKPQHDPRAEEKEMVMKEMMPYLLYAAIPIIITIFLAYTFGPTV